MLVDLEEIGSTPPSVQKITLCIAGAGIAGLALAVASAEAGLDVHLLEAGGRTDEARSQEIYDAEMADVKHFGTTIGRYRVFGGSSTRWGGQLLPFTEETFSPPPELSAIGWPICSSELEPFYSRIERILGTNSLPFTIDLTRQLKIPAPTGLFSHPDLRLRFSKWAPFSHRNLAKTLGARAIESSKVTVFLHGNLTECLLSPDGTRVEAFLARNYRGVSFRFVADHYVLATGTIETSRMLLASRSVCPNGVGNTHDRLGRSFHDHVSAPVAELHPAGRRILLPWMGPVYTTGTTHSARLEATVQLRRKLNLPAIMAHLEIKEPEDSGAFLARHLLRCIQRGDVRSALSANYRRIMPASLEVLRLAYSARFKKTRSISSRATILLQIGCEQRPENRIRLSKSERDKLGIPRAVVDWRVSPEEMSSLRRYARWLRKELIRLGVNAFDWYPQAMDGNMDPFSAVRDTNHPMGGTVMGVDPASSVVDTNLQVHGLSNLYIASCSTFPAGSSSNPTFTLIALVLRLAERLRQITTRSSSVINQATT